MATSYVHTPLTAQEDDPETPDAPELNRVSSCRARGALGLLGAACALVLITNTARRSWNERQDSQTTTHWHSWNDDTVSLAASIATTEPPCQCESHAKSWKKKERSKGSKPKCVYLALGANDGDMYQTFLTSSASGTAEDLGSWKRLHEVNYIQAWKTMSVFQRASGWVVRKVQHLTGTAPPVFRLGPDHQHGSECEAYLVEADNKWSDELDEVIESAKKQTPGAEITAIVPKCVFMCEGTATFEVDSGTSESIGSSMGRKEDKDKERFQKNMKVPTMNLLKFLYENTTPEDFVILDMDIEGAEFDILPCLAKSPAAELVDELYMEVHHFSWSMTHPTKEQMIDAVDTLVKKGVIFPDYSVGVKV